MSRCAPSRLGRLVTIGGVPGWFGVQETARRVGWYRRTERSLFEILGGWVGSTPEADAKRLLATHGQRHAWHAELWDARMPQLPDPGRTADARARDATVAFVESVAGAESTLDRVVGIYRVVVPRLIGAYECHRESIDAATDAPTDRCLTLVLRDSYEQWHAGERLIQRLIRSTDDVARATDRQARIEALAVALPSIAGADSPAR